MIQLLSATFLSLFHSLLPSSTLGHLPNEVLAFRSLSQGLLLEGPRRQLGSGSAGSQASSLNRDTVEPHTSRTPQHQRF